MLFAHAFGVAPPTSALTFAIIVFVGLPLFVVAGRLTQRHGPALAMAGGLAARVVPAGGAGRAGHIPAVLPFAAFSGILFAWSFLSVAPPRSPAS